MEAVNMPSTSQVKSQMRTASADTPKGGDEFMKLLQVKKDQARPEKADAKKPDDKGGKKDVEDVPEGGKDDSQDTGEEKVSSKDAGEQDSLLQAAMQQAAAQMAGIVTEQPGERTAEPMKAEDGGPVPAETVPTEEVPQLETAAEQPMEHVGALEQEKEADPSGDNGTEQNGDSGFKALGGEKASERETEVQSYKSQSETKPREKVQSEEKTDTRESLYGTAAARTESEQSFETQKTEEVPLKTSQDTLPQDLGRTLADRFSGAGRELVVELEPANLGKLTIKMVYEAGRAAVSIIATNPKTLEILNQKAAEIAGILEEKTGQETVIYTQEAWQESQEENPEGNQGGRGEQQRREERHQTGENNRHDAESFAQQLRLGLV